MEMNDASSLPQSEVTRFCQGKAVQVQAFQGSRLDHASDRNVKLDSKNAGDVESGHGGHRDKCPRLQPGSQYCRWRRQGGGLLMALAEGFCAEVGALPGPQAACDLKRSPGTDGGDQVHMPEQQLEPTRKVGCIVQLVQCALAAQSAFPRPDRRNFLRRSSQQGTGDRRYERSVCDPEG
jgi:hypothetical protein